ncbi:hypothetical protein GCM10009850_072250 [Nonomuraea monospora]|uniref:Uncharacterized protein n=1 Tax=Nonomuraea monospora TaxID=568818 RepID=A0ABP5PJ94_9ACTN
MLVESQAGRDTRMNTAPVSGMAENLRGPGGCGSGDRGLECAAVQDGHAQGKAEFAARC